ncbi:acyltransferase domain-containing protein, partial [Streptomyces sp. BE303]|uniref:acyltransferase domain-containing protein n=1 Tax=Streptomyces sp. BE303 TaxID=3002528 RepID=UPI002E775C2B
VVNGPGAVVVAGLEAEIDAVAEAAGGRGWKSSRLRTSHAFHSRLMEPMLEVFSAVVRGLTFAEPSVPAVSTVTGRPVGVGQWSDAESWVDQVRKPVRVADALAALDGVTRFVELGPDGELSALVQPPYAVPGPLPPRPQELERGGRQLARSLSPVQRRRVDRDAEDAPGRERREHGGDFVTVAAHQRRRDGVGLLHERGQHAVRAEFDEPGDAVEGH